MSKYDERFEAVTERTATAMYAFWSAMLTAHTVLLSVAVALPSAVSSISAWQYKPVAIVATLCMVALLFNFATMRMQYEAIGRQLLDLDAELTEVRKAQNIEKANARRLLMRLSEYFSAFGLVAEAILLSWVLVL